MAKLGLDLSENKVSKPSVFTTVPAGEYKVVVAHAEIKEAKSGGNYIEFGYEIVDGSLAGAMVKDIVNIINANKEAERIGRDRLKTIAVATGAKNPNKIADTDELLNKTPFAITVTVEEDGQYKNNRVKYINILTASETAKEEAPKAKAASKKPWE